MAECNLYEISPLTLVILYSYLAEMTITTAILLGGGVEASAGRPLDEGKPFTRSATLPGVNR